MRRTDASLIPSKVELLTSDRQIGLSPEGGGISGDSKEG
jgi:hypothetical protein